LISFLYIYLAKREPDQPAIEQAFINSFMRIFEIELPKSPEQQRLDQLRASSKRASDAVKLERNRQKMQRAQKAMQALRAPAIKKPTSTV
jgi:hypothetical protein